MGGGGRWTVQRRSLDLPCPKVRTEDDRSHGAIAMPVLGDRVPISVIAINRIQ